MDLTVEDVAKLLANDKKQSTQYLLGVVAESHIEEGYYLVGVDNAPEFIRASAFCSAFPGDRVLVLILPNGMCAALATKGYGDSPSSPANWVVEEGDYTVNRQDGYVLNWHIKRWSNKFTEL